MTDLSYSASVEPEALPGRANPRFPEEVSPTSYGEQVGQGIENAGAVLNNVYDKAQSQAQQSQLADAHNQLQVLQGNLTHDPTTGAFSKQGKDAFGLNQQYLPQWDQQSAAIIAGIPDPKARQAAVLASGQMRNQLSEQLDSHELQQHKEFGIKTAQASISLAQQAGAANYNHPDILRDNLDTIGVSLDNLGRQQGWSQDEIDAAKQEQTSKFHSNVIDRILADNKIGMAQTYLDSTKTSMDANTAWTAQRTIDAQLRESQNEQRQDIADRFGDSMEAASYGLPNAVTVTRPEMDILYPKDAQRHWDGLQMMAAAGTQARQYDQMTPAQISADVEAARPTQGGPEASINIKAFEIRANAADRSLRARAQDPAQFAIDSGFGWKPLDLSNPQEALTDLRARANTQGTLSEQTGVNTPLLSKAETQQVVGWLNHQSPEDRLRTLTSLRSTLPDDQSYASLMKQIAPGSPITAIAGASLDRPTNGNIPNWYNAAFATSPVVGQRMLEGEQILKAKDEKGIVSKFPMPKDTDLMAQFTSAIGGSSSDLFRGRPDTLDSYWAAYKAAYAAEANHAGVSNGVISQDLANRAASDVIGHVTQYGATNLVVPSGMDPSRFAGNVNTATRAALIAAGYSDKPDPSRPGFDSDLEAFRGHGLRELGDTLGTGRYVIINGNGDPLKSKDGKKPVIIDLNQQFRIPMALPAGPIPLPTQPDAFNNPANRDTNWGK